MSGRSKALKKLWCGHFTLVELMLVVAIIAILMTILLPALKTVKEKAKSITCTNNQKQMSTSFMMYASDFDGWLPCTLQQSFPAGSWCYMISPYAEGETWEIAAGLPLNSKPIYFCPSSKDSITSGPYAGNYKHNQLLSYGYNSYLFDLNYKSYNRKVGQFAQPDTLLMTADLEYPAYTNQPVYLGLRLGNMIHHAPWRPECVSRRHNNGSNVLFVDGHVTWEPISVAGFPCGMRFHDAGTLY